MPGQAVDNQEASGQDVAGDGGALPPIRMSNKADLVKEVLQHDESEDEEAGVQGELDISDNESVPDQEQVQEKMVREQLRETKKEKKVEV